jgi:hypothetical protein
MFSKTLTLAQLKVLLRKLQGRLKHNRRGDIQEIVELKRQINSVQEGINNLTEAIQCEGGEIPDETI